MYSIYINDINVPIKYIILPIDHVYKRGRPPLEYIKKCLRAKAYARAKVKEAANNDVNLLLHTAEVTSSDKNLSFSNNVHC